MGGPVLRELWERESMGCPEGREGLEPWKEEASKAWERVGAGVGIRGNQNLA